MMKSKKGGVEEPRTLIYEVFSMILFIFAILIVFGYFKDPNFDVNFLTQELEFDIQASKMTNTLECAAWEDSDGGVHPGILVDEKLTKLIQEKRTSCLIDEYELTKYIYDGDGTFSAFGSKGGMPLDNPFEIYLTKIRYDSTSAPYDGALLVRLRE